MSNASIYGNIFIENDKLQTKMNKIGKINNIEELNLFSNAKNGTNTELKLSK